MVAAGGLFTGDPLIPIPAALFLICNLIVLFGVGRRAGKKTLLSARSIGKFGWYSSAVVLGLTLLMEESGVEILTYMGLFTLAHGGVMVSAKKLLVLQEGLAVEEIRWLRLVAATGASAVIVPFLLYGTFLSGVPAAQRLAREAAAVSSLRKISNCLAAYADTHPGEGFPMSLRELGPENTGCLGEQLVQGEREGYRFAYDPEASGSEEQNRRYTVTARPTRYGRSGQQSFFSDESSGIRFTYEDRAAHAEDSLLE